MRCAGPRPRHRWRFQARTFSDCAIGVPLLIQFRSDRVQSLRLENETAGKHACGKMMDLRKADAPKKRSPRVE